jgi:hypothetical protein
MPSNQVGTVIRLMQLLSAFAADSWATWRAVLKAAHALDLTNDERQIVESLTQRQTLPSAPVRELWLLLGRRSGKSIIAALLAVWATCCRTYTLAPGEVGVFMVVAADRRQARVVKRYVSGLLRAHPSLEVLLERETAEAIWLTNGLCIEIHRARSAHCADIPASARPSMKWRSGTVRTAPTPTKMCSSRCWRRWRQYQKRCSSA